MITSIVLCIAILWNMAACGVNEQGEEIVREEMTVTDGEEVCFERIIVDENGWGSSSINVSKFRNSAVLTIEGGRQVVAYYDGDGSATLALLEDSDIHRIKIKDDMNKNLLGDGHCSINIGYADGWIYYAYGAHSLVEVYYGVVAVDDFYKTKAVNAQENNHLISYPQFYKVGEKLWFVYRDDEDEGWAYVDLTGETEMDFSREQTILSDTSLYMNDIGVSEDGMFLAIPFVERYPSDGDLVRNDGIYLIWSSDGGETWSSACEDNLSLPVAKEQTAKVIDIGLYENLMNQESTFVTGDGDIYFTRMTNDENGVPQVYLTYYNIKDQTCKSYCVSDNDVDFDLLGAGTLILPLSRAEIAVSDHQIYVIYRQEGSIVIASAEKEENEIGEFDRLTLSDFNVGLWEPNYDQTLWDEEGILCLFVQKTSQEESDILAEERETTPIYLYYFK